MSMLAEPRRRKQYHLNPRGKALYEDDSRFGTKMLEKMGWSKGKGLGAKENGSLDFVRVRYKDDAEGLGFDADARDDQWTAHEQNFSGLLKSLNGETEDTVENTKNNEFNSGDASDSEMRPLGFGFQSDPIVKEKKSKKLTEKISGESLEEKSKASKARVHYKKFTRGKDLSRYSEKDLANIFGKKATDVQADDGSQPLINLVEYEPTNSGENEVKPNFGGVQTISGSLSVTDYFKQKMAALKNKLNTGNKEGSESQSLLDKTEVPEPENATEESKKKKKKRKNESPSEETELLQNIENVEPAKKKKKKNVDEAERQETIGDLENNVNPMVNEEKSQKKKKKKSKKENDRIEDEDTNSHQSEAQGLLVDDEGKEKKKKQTKKAKKEEKIQDQDEENSKQTEDEVLLTAKNIDDDNNERSHKKKKKKAKKERCEEQIEQEKSASPVESITEMRSSEEPIEKKSKKNKKSKEATEVEEVSAAKPKKAKKVKSKEEDAVLLAPHDVSETLENSEKTPADSSSNDESDASELMQPQKELLSMDELLQKRDSFNVLTISTFCAEKFRHFNMDAYKGSTLSQIVGYGCDENLKLNVVVAKSDQKRIMDMWMGRKTKYSKDQKQFHKIAAKKNQKQKVKHLRAFKRHNIFTVV